MPNDPATFTAKCPMDAQRQSILERLGRQNNLVVCAPPGSGKSSRVPLWLMDQPWIAGKKILMLEPRRVAARSLARYMAGLLGEKPGKTIGWRMRGSTLVSDATRIEIITEGVLTRLLLRDQGLNQAGCVIFDEFHERSLQTDMGLALCRESQIVLRPELRLVVMSATLDTAKAAQALGGCANITAEDRAYPVDIRWLPQPAGLFSPGREMWRHAADVVRRLLRQETGGILVFLPGAWEIRFVAGLLSGNLPEGVILRQLYGNLPPDSQDAAIAPAGEGRRKVVLATSIAETSLTIEDIRIVVDCGFRRFQQFDAASGLNRLVTGRVSLAEARQRAGRAGRSEAGICCRLWQRAEESGLSAQRRPEIFNSDLSEMVLQLANWGIMGRDAIQSLAWPDSPPAGALDDAGRLLHLLGAFSADGKLTEQGKKMAALPLSPRLSRLLLKGREMGITALSCCLAALLEGQDPLWQTEDPPQANLLQRIDWLCNNAPVDARKRETRAWAARLARFLKADGNIFPKALKETRLAGLLIALGWPERISMHKQESSAAPASGQNAKASLAFFKSRSGHTASLPAADPLASEEFLAVAALTMTGTSGRIRLAARLERSLLEKTFASEFKTADTVEISPDGEVLARRERRFGSLVLSRTPLPHPPPEECAALLCEFLRANVKRLFSSLPQEGKFRQWRARVAFLRTVEGNAWPDVTDETLAANLEQWLAPHLAGLSAVGEISEDRLYTALRQILPRGLTSRLDMEAPTQWRLPSGSTRPIIYGDEGGPWLGAKLQEFFGCRETPRIAGGRVPLTLKLNSPAGRPLQITRDLAGFWQNGYPAVRSEMLGRYPRHPWPSDPLTAPPTALSKKALRKGTSGKKQ